MTSQDNFGSRPASGGGEGGGSGGTGTRPGQGNRYMEIELRALLRNELPETLVSFDDKLLATVRGDLPITHPAAELLPCLTSDNTSGTRSPKVTSYSPGQLFRLNRKYREGKCASRLFLLPLSERIE